MPQSNENNLINPFPSQSREYYQWRYWNIPGLRRNKIEVWRKRRAQAAALRPPKQRIDPDELKRRKAARHRAYMRRRYAEDPCFRAAYKRRVAVARARYKAIAKAILLEAKRCGCLVCGEKEISCLDFHHKNPEEKEFNVAQYMSKATKIQKLELEISKCIVLCANCHRKYHAGVICLG